METTFDGVVLPLCVNNDKLREVKEYTPKSDDIFVVSFPKSGSTWMDYIVHEILNDCCEPPLPLDMYRNFGSIIEMFGIKQLDENGGIKKHFKSHLPFSYMPYNEDAKYIYIVRNPWDRSVSGFNFVTQLLGTEYAESFDDYFDKFINGKTVYGSYFSHVVSWFQQRDKENILFVMYEEAKSNPKETLLKIAEFLGDEYFDNLNSNEEKVEKILEYTSFEYMKKLEYMVPKDMVAFVESGIEGITKNLRTEDMVKVDFFKRGNTGYSLKDYSKKHNDRMKKAINEHFASFPELLEVWKKFGFNV